MEVVKTGKIIDSDLLRNMSGIKVYQSKYVPEKNWYNPVRKKWVKDKYLTRTKHKVLKPCMFLMGSAIHVHPNNYKIIEEFIKIFNLIMGGK